MAERGPSIAPRYVLSTSMLPTILAGLLVFTSGYFTYHPPEAWRGAMELWGGLVFIGACLAGTPLFIALLSPLAGLEKLEVKRTEDDRVRLAEAMQGLDQEGKPLYPIVVDAGEHPVLEPASGGRLIISTCVLRNLEPGKLRLLLVSVMKRQAMSVRLERVLFTAAIWWLAALTIVRLPLPIWVVVVGAAITITAQVFIQQALIRREISQADKRAAESCGKEALADAIATSLALRGTAGRREALTRIAALELELGKAEEIATRHFS